MLKVLISLSLLIIPLHLYAEIGILPYRVDNPSSSFGGDIGLEYSKLLSTAAIYKKGIEIMSPRDAVTDLKRLGISIDKTVTGADLYMFGKTRYLDYILIGSVSKLKNVYISKSILYSVREKRRVSRVTVKAPDLFKLAEKEVNEVFVQYPDINVKKGDTIMDLAFLIDSSYRINDDWKMIRKSIIDISRSVIDRMGIDTRVFIVPYSANSLYQDVRRSENSIKGIKRIFSSIKPRGGNSTGKLVNALKYSLRNIKWRKNSSKAIIIINNSNLKNNSFAEKYAIIASRKKLKIHSVSLGNLKGDESELVKKISDITGGVHKYLSYRQSIYNTHGDREDIYFENGRFFRSRYPVKTWENGLVNSASGNSSFSDEILYNENRIKLTPYNMSGNFIRITGDRVIKELPLQSNILKVLNDLILPGNENKSGMNLPIGKALISDGKISFWMHIYDRKFMKYFSSKLEDKYFFPLGVEIRSNPKDPYGISLVPKTYKILPEFIPRMSRATFSNFIKRKNFYMKFGLFYPPVWFTNVKIERIDFIRKAEDIRDE